MREIKFRAWNKSAKVMTSLSRLMHLPQETEGEFTFLMQYTGLKDKNGVEIYEGDIIKSSHSDDKWRGEIIWRTHHGTGFWVSDDRMIIKSSYCNPLSSNNSVTNDAHMWLVVGNIHENPELLGKPAPEIPLFEGAREALRKLSLGEQS